MNCAKRFPTIILLSFFMVSGGLAATKKKPKEKEALLQSARELFLQKKRTKALDLLLSKGSEHQAEAIKISERFLTDQAQSEFETAESQRLAQVEGAAESYKNAQSLEPDNLMIKQGLMLVHFENKKCDAARAEFDKLVEIFPSHPRKPYFEYLISRCEDRPSEHIDIQQAQNMGFDPIYLQLANVYSDYSKERPQSALETISQIRENQSFPPAVYFWSWKIQKELGKSPTEDLKKYIQVCKSSGEPEKRMYKWDPYYCSNLKAAEDAFQASRNN